MDRLRAPSIDCRGTAQWLCPRDLRTTRTNFSWIITVDDVTVRASFKLCPLSVKSMEFWFIELHVLMLACSGEDNLFRWVIFEMNFISEIFFFFQFSVNLLSTTWVSPVSVLASYWSIFFYTRSVSTSPSLLQSKSRILILSILSVVGVHSLVTYEKTVLTLARVG